MRRDRIVIEQHDPRWARSFRVQADAVEVAVRDWLVAPVHHIGSTSVPGLPAKPIIDMLALVDDHRAFGAAFDRLQRIGWVSAPEPGDQAQHKWSVCYPSIEYRTHHLHVVEYRSSDWRDWLLFRDYLRAHDAEVERYAMLKRDLAAADDQDRVRYRAGKAPLITEILSRARAWSRTHATT